MDVIILEFPLSSEKYCKLFSKILFKDICLTVEFILYERIVYLQEPYSPLISHPGHLLDQRNSSYLLYVGINSNSKPIVARN